MATTPNSINDREIIFETFTIGDAARISAIDSATGLEVTVLGPANAARHDLERLARRKLERALIERGVIEPGDASDAGSAPPRGGKLV